jgi:Transglutaminase-like superfamily
MRFLFWKALFRLAAFDLFLRGNFARLHHAVRTWKVSDQEPSNDVTGKVCDAVNLACVWYPKHVLCLQRSAVTTCLLRSYGVPAYMVLGAQKLPFKAHAWVEVAGRAVNESREVQSIYHVWERC